jgi:hypothetical protein
MKVLSNFNGASSWTRTSNLIVRTDLLYPIELWRLLSGIRESNSFLLLGRESYYRCTNPAILVGVTGIEPATSRSQTVRSTDELHPDLLVFTLKNLRPSFLVLRVRVELTSEVFQTPAVTTLATSAYD